MRSKVDHYVCYKQVGKFFIYVVLYVNDMFLVGNNMEVIKEVKTHLSSKFDMRDLSASNLILGMEIKRNHADRKLYLNQRKYVKTIFHRFNMQECKSVKVPIPVGLRLFAKYFPKTQEEEEEMSSVPYANVVGSLMYAIACTRSNIAHAVGFLSRYMSKLGKEIWIVVKMVFRYLHGTIDHAICYQGRVGLDRVMEVHGFADVD